MYIGLKKIKSFQEENGMIAVIFEDCDDISTYHKNHFEFIQTTEPADDSEFMHINHLFLQEELYSVLLKYDTSLDEVSILLQKLDNSIKDNFRRTVAKLWGKELPKDQVVVPNITENKTMKEMHDIL